MFCVFYYYFQFFCFLTKLCNFSRPLIPLAIIDLKSPLPRHLLSKFVTIKLKKILNNCPASAFIWLSHYFLSWFFIYWPIFDLSVSAYRLKITINTRPTSKRPLISLFRHAARRLSLS